MWPQHDKKLCLCDKFSQEKSGDGHDEHRIKMRDIMNLWPIDILFAELTKRVIH